MWTQKNFTLSLTPYYHQVHDSNRHEMATLTYTVWCISSISAEYLQKI